MNQVQQRKLQREETILLSLRKLDYLTRRQMQKLHQLGNERNARRVLKNLSPYLSSFRNEIGENVFYLNKAGRERVDCETIRSKSPQVSHFLMRNDVFLHYAGNEDWKNEMKFSVPDVVTVICDAYFRYNQRRHFLEVDHLQHMTKNREKVERYKKLKATNTLQERLKYFPRLVWVTMTESRKQQLAELCKDFDCMIHVWQDIK